MILKYASREQSSSACAEFLQRRVTGAEFLQDEHQRIKDDNQKLQQVSLKDFVMGYLHETKFPVCSGSTVYRNHLAYDGKFTEDWVRCFGVPSEQQNSEHSPDGQASSATGECGHCPKKFKALMHTDLDALELGLSVQYMFRRSKIEWQRSEFVNF